MTAADELERMAEELEKLEDAQEFGPMFERGIAEGLRRARVLLESRAAELRAATPTVWSVANGSVSVGADGSLEFRRPDGSKICDLGEGLPLLIDCTAALLLKLETGPRVAEPGLPKPERVEPGQWWQIDGTTEEHKLPFRLDSVHVELAAGRSVTGAMHIGEVKKMLIDPRYRYLGDGERPDLGASEVAGEVER
jgi:hypothetical protein